MSKIKKIVNPVRNSLKILNHEGIILKSNHGKEQWGIISNGVNCLIITWLILISLLIAPVSLGDEASQVYFINLDQSTISKGYTITAFNGVVKLSVQPAVLSLPTGVEILEINENMPLPWQLTRLSKIYQFELKNKLAYNQQKPFYLEIKYDQASDYYKQVFFYDKNYASWRPLPTVDNPTKSTVKAKIGLPFARLAVFANKEVPVIGKASWYSYKKGNFAASPDFPKKSKLRVYNLDNNKYVDVEINDFGPDKKKYPDRVIDLEKTVFKKLASHSEGVINVRIEPLYIVPEAGRILGLASTGATVEPVVTAKSAILMDEKSSEILWQNNATTTLPLASLTKLVAIKVFLDLRPSLNQPVIYSIKDEQYNYQYCKEWESAKINLKEGDRLTIQDLVYAALVGSANNAIETLVRVSGLERQKFISQMNQAVKNWGATATYFVEPTGLAPENISSALDYAIITKEVYSHPIIQKASTLPNYKFATLNTKKIHNFVNTNQLIRNSDLTITGSKTGYLDEAGYCLMIRAKDKNGRQVIAVTFGADSRELSFIETEELAKYGFYKLEN